ncbi:DUF4845 domain-containing protein [Pseudomonas putida]|uniref:DUF4845 domain-containing protein n=1 Tax=Pseudomonas putida TaxID=303 RepID=UPI0023635449|nr:DUF4845 domain-containing protein [Pseudomonas putida]MDD2054531.1 DUF4845 domain-containing protein [Pseudomonas putida]
MTFTRNEKGLSFVGWLLVLALLGLSVNLAMKLVPHYLDYLSMKKIIASVGTDRATGVSTVDDFYQYVARGMKLNNIQDVDLNKALSVTLENNRFLAHLSYEAREPLIKNIDLLVKFDQDFSVVKP